MGRHPQPKRRSYIPRAGSGKGRPLDISCFEDKLVELAVKNVLELIYEEYFEDSSYGYPPVQQFCLSRNAHPVQMAQPQEPAQGIQLGSVQPGSEERRLATRTHPQRPESLSKRGGLLNDWSKSRMGRKAACPVLRGGGYQLSSWVRYCGTAGKPGGKRRKQTLPYRAGSACPTQKKIGACARNTPFGSCCYALTCSYSRVYLLAMWARAIFR